jgi:predicted phage terminase large subunit-like protein
MRRRSLTSGGVSRPAIPRTTLSLVEWTTQYVPEFTWYRVHEFIAPYLQRMVDGDPAMRKVMLFCPPRLGKLLADDTPVWTPRGWTMHGSLRPGDLVYRPDGTTTRVVAVSDPAPADVRVEFTNGEVVYAHEAHEWTIHDRADRVRRTVETGHFLRTTKHGKPVSLWSGGRARFQVDRVQPREGVSQALPLDPYALGVWLGDGSVAKPCITFDARDAAMADAVQARLGMDATTYVHKTTGVHTRYYGQQGRGHTGRFTQQLQAAGVLGNKHVPPAYLRASVSQRLDLLAGLVDSDGTVHRTTGRVTFSTTNDALRDAVVELVRGMGWHATVSSIAPRTSSSGIVGRQTTHMVAFNPTRSLPCVLPRKQGRITTTERRVGIRAVTRDACGKIGRCVQVEAEDGLYCVGRTHVPTHNSTMVSRILPAYGLARAPDEWTAVVSYGAKLAHRLSRNARMHYQRYRELAKDSKAADVWETGFGGGCWAAGIGGPASGFGYRIGVIDDPVKDWAEANSDALIERNIDWWDAVFTTRRDASRQHAVEASMLLTMTRYTMRDLAGHILATAPEGWTVLHLPMLYEPRDEILAYYDEMSNNAVSKGTLRVVTDWRTHADEPLCPERLNHAVYAREVAARGPHIVSALYQQRPSPRSGAMFPREKVTLLPAPPSRDRIAASVRYWDKAGTEGGTGAATSGVLVHRLHDGRYVIADVQWGRMGALEREALIETTARLDGFYTSVWVEQEPGSGGKESAENTVRRLAGFNVHAERVTGDKVLRAEPLSAQWQAGNVCVVQAPWTEAFLQEAGFFPTGRRKDQIDATSGAFNKVAAQQIIPLAPATGGEQHNPYPM